MNATDKLRAILKTLGYTPTTLAKAINITPHKAKRIFKDGGKIKADEFMDICHLIKLEPMSLIRGGVAV